MATMTVNWNALAQKALDGKCLSLQEALHVLQADEHELLPLLHAAFQVRSYYFGKKVRLHLIMNAKSGHCPENCGYCAQSAVSQAPITSYPLLDKQALLQGAHHAVAAKAATYCIVASGRKPTAHELAQCIEAVKEIKATLPLKICVSLGMITRQEAEQLKQAGVDTYNHNLNTSRGHFDEITTSHTYEDRVRTVQAVKAAGLSACSGVIVGMGEGDEEIVEMGYALRELDCASIPINFLNAIPGTPLEHRKDLTPHKCLKVLALMRFVCPDKEIRIAGGREVNLRSLQPLGLYAANSIFVGHYLTTAGQGCTTDHQMLEDLGFEIEQSG